MLKIDFCLPRSIRIKLNKQCQFKCKFCHQEGDFKTKDIKLEELLFALDKTRKELHFYRLHFTGGEPTLYSEFEKILFSTKKLGFQNALTTNGQFKTENIRKLKKNLDSINFSLHTLNPYVFLGIQNIKTDRKEGLNWADNCIKQTMQNAIISNKILKTKINCVVGRDSIGPKEVLQFCMQNNISLRFLNDLNLGAVATNTIKEIISENKAKLIGHEITLLSSSHKLEYAIGDYRFAVKCIRPFYLDTLCMDCSFKGTKHCLEGFYGIRLESSPIMVRLCLNKQGIPFVQPLDKFLKSKQFLEIKETTKLALNYLKRDSLLEEQKFLTDGY
jgi:molybdenum cofactor biosynthesis enzyme MoaA